VGLALTIIVGQLPKLFGVEKGAGAFFQKLWDVIKQLGDTHVVTRVIGLASLAIVLGLRRFAPTVPRSLVAVAFGVSMVAVFNLNKHGVAIVGHIPRGLPSIGVPNAVKWRQWKLHLFKQASSLSTWTPYNAPHIHNLEWDPREEHEVDLPHGWVIHPMPPRSGRS
jgi:MFS superfamily sulfate permease-like transporter